MRGGGRGAPPAPPTRCGSGSVWSSYRKGCVDTVMRWLVPEGPGRGVHRMTNEALHKGGGLGGSRGVPPGRGGSLEGLGASWGGQRTVLEESKGSRGVPGEV